MHLVPLSPWKLILAPAGPGTHTSTGDWLAAVTGIDSQCSRKPEAQEFSRLYRDGRDPIKWPLWLGVSSVDSQCWGSTGMFPPKYGQLLKGDNTPQTSRRYTRPSQIAESSTKTHVQGGQASGVCELGEKLCRP